MDLVLDQTGVGYSTPLESFETSVINLFDKGILSTHNIPQLDKVPLLIAHKSFLWRNYFIPFFYYCIIKQNYLIKMLKL